MEVKLEDFVRNRITELRIKKNVSEHRMSLELGKSGSYIRGITSGMALPSLRELFNIFSYLEVTPLEFFAPLEKLDTPCDRLCVELRGMSENDLAKVATFIGWLTEK